MEYSGHNPEQETEPPINRLVADILRFEGVDDRTIEGCIRYITDVSSRPQFTPEAATGCAKLWETYISVLEHSNLSDVPKNLQFTLRDAIIMPLVFCGAFPDQPPMTLDQAITQVTKRAGLDINRTEAYSYFVNGLRKLWTRVNKTYNV